MQSLLSNRFPILLIDESQDTNKLLMNAFLAVQKGQAKDFALGLFGDTMQRIYGDGMPDLGQNLPPDWARPAKRMNHRCPKRIIRLINQIRSTVDGQEQVSRIDKTEGFIRLFIGSGNTCDKSKVESQIADRMGTITGDALWTQGNAGVKILLLEHHMAARRMGFLEMFDFLYGVETLRTGLLDGTLPGLRLFSGLVLPLLESHRRGDRFAISTIVRLNSPLLSKNTIQKAGNNQIREIQKARDAVNKLLKLWDNGGAPRFLDVLNSVNSTGLFEIPEVLRPIAARSDVEQRVVEEELASGKVTV